MFVKLKRDYDEELRAGQLGMVEKETEDGIWVFFLEHAMHLLCKRSDIDFVDRG